MLRITAGSTMNVARNLMMAFAMLSAACASTGTPHPFPTPGAPARPSAPVTPSSEPHRTPINEYDLVGTALDLRGTPYRDGGTDPSGFDCSGFTQYVFSRYGVALPRDVRAQYRTGVSISPDDLVPGDLVFFVTAEPDVSHVAIAIGGDEFVHAPSSTGVVRVEHLSAAYWASRFLGARRVN